MALYYTAPINKRLITSLSLMTGRTPNDKTRPIMYTFYNLKKDHQGIQKGTLGDQDLLHLWSTKWNEVGWDTKILTIDDAKRHPRFEEYNRKLAQVPLRGNKNEDYNRLCYYRWLAVAAVGGGWMSDMDVLPLNFHHPEKYYQDGQFTIYSAIKPYGGIPCLMSGSQSEWERLAFATVENGAEHQQYEKFWSDMFATLDLHVQDPDTYKLLDLMGEVTEVKTWDEDMCKQYSQKLAVHFSHSSMHKMGLNDINKRYVLAGDWMDKWKASCSLR